MGIRSSLVAAIRNGVAVARMEFDAGLAQHNAEYELRQIKTKQQQLDARITGDYIPASRLRVTNSWSVQAGSVVQTHRQLLPTAEMGTAQH